MILIDSEFQTRTFIATIRGVTTGVADAVNVVIDSDGQLGTVSSSRRFKTETKPMDETSLPAGLEMRIITSWHSPAESGGTTSGSISRR